jgi:hypothetical protein
MNIMKKLFNSRKDADYWKDKYEQVKQAYDYEILKNEAWSHAICNASIAKRIPFEGQTAIYDLYNAEMEGIRKVLK